MKHEPFRADFFNVNSLNSLALLSPHSLQPYSPTVQKASLSTRSRILSFHFHHGQSRTPGTLRYLQPSGTNFPSLSMQSFHQFHPPGFVSPCDGITCGRNTSAACTACTSRLALLALPCSPDLTKFCLAQPIFEENMRKIS